MTIDKASKTVLRYRGTELCTSGWLKKDEKPSKSKIKTMASSGYDASARLNVPNQRLSKSKYKKVIAIKLKGFPREIVIVNEEEFNSLKPKIKKELFEELS